MALLSVSFQSMAASLWPSCTAKLTTLHSHSLTVRPWRLALASPIRQWHSTKTPAICPQATLTGRALCRPSDLPDRCSIQGKGLATVLIQKQGAQRIRASGPGDAPMAPKEIPLFPAERVEVTVVKTDPGSWQGDLLAYAAFDSKDAEAKASVQLANAVKERLGGGSWEGLFEEVGKPGSSSFARVAIDGLKAVGGVSLGEQAAGQRASVEWGKTPFQLLGEAVADAAKAHKAARVGIAFVDGAASLDSDLQIAAVEKIALGLHLGGYAATRFKAKPPKSELRQVELLNLASQQQEKAAAAAQRAADVAKGIILARYLVETPANICKPAYLADAAKHIADSAPDVMKLEVLEEAECEALGMGLFLGVSECSEAPGKLIHLTYTPPGGDSGGKVIGLVGKGLTFDSGGYNLKVGGMIEMMKFDMGGAAAVLGAAQALALLKPKGVTIHIISASCENMIDGKGMRPGDVLTGASGKTVEVDNTDAEGRLTLADALWFAQEKCGVQAVVDIATLTGACMVGLGKDIAGLFTPSSAMAESLRQAGETSGEKLWRLPMEDNYLEILKSPIADLKNTGIATRFGGAITASLFLREFVNTEKVEWAHLDIAGPAWNDKQGGATGFGAHVLTEWAVAQGQP